MSGIQAESHRFLYELQSCIASGTFVRCTFFVTNRGEDRELMISDRERDRIFDPLQSRLIDDTGNIAMMREAKLANYDRYGGTLVSGVRTRLIVDFDGVSAAARTLSILDLSCVEGPTNRPDSLVFSFVECHCCADTHEPE